MARKSLRRRFERWLGHRLSRVLDPALGEILSKRRPFDIERVAFLRAADEAGQFVAEHMGMAPNLVTARELTSHCLEAVTVDGLWLEFGVYRGTSISHIATYTSQPVFGFDSFEGLPEDWTGFQQAGRFSLGGELPGGLPDNVELVKGWFDESLAPFLDEHPGAVAFVHVDCDLYSSSKTVLDLLTPRMVEGSVILFDEFFNYPQWREHEYKAFMEFIAATGWEYEYLGYASSHFSVGVRLTKQD